MSLDGSVQGSSPERGKGRQAQPLPPLVSAALDPALSLEERLRGLATGERGRYTPLGEVARGGMGRILRVWDQRLGRELAMKVVARQPARDASDEDQADHARRLTRFIDEARITAQLDHPSIVPVHEVGLDEGGSVFFTMPLVRGQHLGNIFEEARAGRNGWSLARVVDVIHKVALTLAFAHQRGVVHRDLKPENVMVGSFGEIYVMDWGLALLLGKKEREGIVGTPAYMSPEQAAGRTDEVGPRSDVYSLGALLYEYFAARRPHETTLESSAGSGASVESILARPPRPLRELAPDVPRELEAIIARAMRHAATARYGDALALAADLRAWLDGRVVSVGASGPWTRLRKWRARNAALARALDALVLLALIGGLVFALKERTWRQAVEAKGREARLGGYSANLAAAELALRAGETSLARAHLENCEGELRGFEWRHLASRADMSTALLVESDQEVRSLAVSRDAARLAAGTDTGRILLIDLHTRGIERELSEHTGPVLDLAFAPDGGTLASASQDDRVLVWDLASEAPPRELANQGEDAVAVAIAADGLRVAWGDRAGVVVVAELATGALVAFDRPERKDGVAALGFLSGSGDLVVAYATGLVKRLDPASLVELASAHPSRTGITDLALAPNGDELALACGTTLMRLDAVDLAPRGSLGPFARQLRAITYAPDGRALASCAHDQALRLWDFARGIELETFLGHADDLNAVVFVGEGSELVSASSDGSVRLWSRASSAVRTLLDGRAWIEGMALAPDGGRALIARRDQGASVVALDDGRELSSWSGLETLDAVAWSARDELALACGPEVWLAERGTLAAPRLLTRLAHPARALAFEAVGRLVVRDASGTLTQLALEDGRVLREIETKVTVEPNSVATLALAVVPAQELVIANLARGQVGVWSLRDGRQRATWELGEVPVTAFALAPDGRSLAIGHADGSAELCTLPEGTVQARFRQHGTILTSLAFDPAGTRLVAGASDKLVHFWCLETLEPLISLRAHVDTLTGVAFTPDGSALVSSAKDGSLRLWRTADLRPRTATEPEEALR